jgi:ABC-2 type transport system ATP-binding protein
MTGFMAPTSGTVRINGHDIIEDSIDARRQIGYLPETAPLYEDMSVVGYLSFCAKLREVPGKDVASRVEQSMKAVHIEQRRSWQIGKLSKGLRRRVGLAQALVHNPKVLIMDEPTEGLDPEQIIEIRRLIQNLRGDHTVILSTHILPEVSQTCHRVVIINRGRVVAVDTPDNLTSRLQGSGTLYIEVDSMGGDARGALAAVPGVTGVAVSETHGSATGFEITTAPDHDVRRELASTIVGRGWGLLELRPMRMSLEEIFLSLTTEETEAPAVAAGDAAHE